MGDSWAELLGDLRPAPTSTLYYADGFWNFHEDRKSLKKARNQSVWEDDSPTKVGRYPKRPKDYRK
jgi:hypothetical protein